LNKNLIRNQHGFSLIESLVSIALLAIALGSFSNSFIDQVRANNQNEIKTGATFAAQKVLDNLRLDDISAMPLTNTSNSAMNVSIGPHTYSVVVTFCALSQYCIDATDTRHIAIAVSHNNKEIYETEAVYTEI